MTIVCRTFLLKRFVSKRSCTCLKLQYQFRKAHGGPTPFTLQLIYFKILSQKSIAPISEKQWVL